MVFAVVPADDLIVFLDKREETVVAIGTLTALLHLSQQPGSADDGMGFQEFGRRCGSHLTRDDARQVFLYWQFVDGHNLIGLYHDTQGTFKHLRLFALPVEVHPDGHVVERERSVGGLWGKGEVPIEGASPQDATFGKLYGLLARNHLALGHVGAVEGKGNLLGTHDTYGYVGLLRIGNERLLVQPALARTLQALYHLGHLFFAERHLVEDVQGHLGGQSFKVFLARGNDQTSHIEGSRTDDHLGAAFCEIAVGTVLLPGEHHR